MQKNNPDKYNSKNLFKTIYLLLDYNFVVLLGYSTRLYIKFLVNYIEVICLDPLYNFAFFYLLNCFLFFKF